MCISISHTHTHTRTHAHAHTHTHTHTHTRPRTRTCARAHTRTCAHAHTHTHNTASSSRALDTLADVLGDFLSKLSKLLRINADQQAENGDIGFQVSTCPGRECKMTDTVKFLPPSVRVRLSEGSRFVGMLLPPLVSRMCWTSHCTSVVLLVGRHCTNTGSTV